jgi:hypothetical protein
MTRYMVAVTRGRTGRDADASPLDESQKPRALSICLPLLDRLGVG